MSNLLNRDPEVTAVQGADGRMVTATPPSSPSAQFEQIARESFEGLGQVGFAEAGSLEELAGIQVGGAGDAFRVGGLEGVMHNLFRPEGQTLEAQSTLAERAAGYAEMYGVRNFLAEAGGGLISDAPIDLALGLTGVGLGGAITRMASKGIGGASMKRAAQSVERIKNAYNRKSGLGMLERARVRAVTEFGVGMAAAGISEGIQNLDGKGSTADEIWDRMLMEGSASVLFSEVLRQGFRGGKAGYKAFVNKVNKQLPKGKHLSPNRLPIPLQSAQNPSPLQGPGVAPFAPGPQVAGAVGPANAGRPRPFQGAPTGAGGLGFEGPTGQTLDPFQGPTQGPVAGAPEGLPAGPFDPRPVVGADSAGRPRPEVGVEGRPEGDPIGPVGLADIPVSIRNIEDPAVREIVEDNYLDILAEAGEEAPDFPLVAKEHVGLIEDAMAESGHLVQFSDRKGKFAQVEDVEFNADGFDRPILAQANNLIDEGPVTDPKLFDSVQAKSADGNARVADVIEEVLEELDKIDPTLAKDVRRVIDASDEVGEASLLMDNLDDALGNYDPNAHAITMHAQPRDSGNFAKSLGHEILHAATAREMMARIQDVNLSGRSFRDDPLLKEAGDMMITMSKAVESGKVSSDNFAPNWDDNLMEFVAEGLTNPDLQKAMRETIDGNKNMLQRFFEWVSQLFGDKVPVDSVSRLADVAEQFASSDVRVQGGAVTPQASPKKATTKQTPRQIAQAKAKANNQADTDIAKQANKDFDTGFWKPATKKAKTFWKAMKGGFAVMTVNNMSLMDTLNGLGPTMQKLVTDMKNALDKSSEMKNTMMSDMESLNKSASEVAALSDAKTKKTINIGGKSYGLNGIQRLSLWLSMADGVNLNWLLGKGQFNHNEIPSSGFARIVEHTNKDGDIVKGKGIRLDNKRDPVNLTDAEFQNMMKSDSLLSPEEKKIALKMLQSYSKNVPWLNKTYSHLLGFKLVKGDGKYAYNPLRSEGLDDMDEIISFQGILGVGRPDQIDVPGFLKKRGDRVLTLQDPLALMNSYIKRVPDAVAYARSSRTILHALGATEGSPQALKEYMKDLMGNVAYKNTLAMVRNLTGDRSDIRTPLSPGFGRMISLANMAKLSLNPVTALKQWGSLWSAQASRVVPGLSGNKVWTDAVALMANPAERKRLIAEARKASPYFDFRQRDHIAFLDDDALQGDEFARLMMLSEGRPSIKELKDMVKRKGLRKRDAWYEMVSRGLEHIKFADEVALAALWKAVKEAGGDGKMLRDLILESQPSYDNLTRSMNQLNRDEFSRSVSAFTTQTRKNASLAMTATYKLMNKENPTTADWKEWIDVVGPLTWQTAYITATGTVGAVATGKLVSMLESDKARERNENLREQTTKKIVQRFARDLLGQIPSIGGDAAVMLASQFLGANSFATGITPVTDIEEALKSIRAKDGSPKFNFQQFIRAMSGTFGSGFAGKLGSAASTRLTD